MSEKNINNPVNQEKKTARPRVSAVLDVTVEKMRAMADSSTIIGEQIVLPDGTVLIPVSKVSYGFASGGSDFGSKNAGGILFGGGGGGGMTVSPVCFISAKDGNVELLPVEIKEGPMGAAERAICMAPEFFDKIVALFKKDDNKEDK
ncbi:MAG: sporulation protein YtfJ [Clostridia bacterium]|nr:sporulation protein YtfJ [Clostridia bacterium]